MNALTDGHSSISGSDIVAGECGATRPKKTLGVDALINAFSTAQFGNAVIAPKAVQHDPDLFFR
jgi:hypothetical protein